jgi:DNA-binding NtrC family response regulator
LLTVELILTFSITVNTIVLVHANSDDRGMYADYLRAHGFRVHEVASTDGALPLIGECQLVITGLLVPGSMSGVDLVAAIRVINASVPIVVVTACIAHEMWQAADAAGCNELLLKPCLPDRLIDAVWRLLDTPPAERRLVSVISSRRSRR